MIPGTAVLMAAALLAAPSDDAAVRMPSSFPSRIWSMEQGLPQDTVTGLSLDPTGYLWVATFGGMARFDGERFEVYDVGTRDDLPGNRLKDVLASPDGTVWTLAQDVGLLRYRDDRFVRIEPIPVTDAYRWLAPDRDGGVWVVGYGDVSRVVEDRLVPVRAGEFSAQGPSRTGGLWLGSSAGEVWQLSSDGSRCELVAAGLAKVTALFEDAAGRLWVGTTDGLWTAEAGGSGPLAPREELSGDVHAIAQAADGSLWVGCDQHLVRWDVERGETQRVAQGFFDRLTLDARGNLWVGSSRGGGLRCVRRSPLHDITAQLELQPSDTWGITRGRAGSILVVQSVGLTELLADGSRFTHVEPHSRTVLLDRRRDLWVGQLGAVQRWRDGEPPLELSDAFLAGRVRAIYETRDGTLWVGSAGGLGAWDGERFQQVHPDELRNVRALLQDPERDALWVGTQTGLARLEDGALSWLTQAEGLSAGSVRALHFDERGVLWVGTYGGGLSRIEDGVITRYSTRTGLADNFLACILEDRQGRFWINSNKGPFVVQRSELERVARGEAERVACVTFTRQEGAREANGGNQPSGWADDWGRFWFPTIAGVTVAVPEELPLTEAPPRVLVESLELSAARVLDARFTALDYSAPSRVRCQYRLVGQDPGWVECVGPRHARYSYVPPGSYAFEVRARNGYGPWSETVRREVTVPSKPYETTAFLVGVLLAVALASFGIAEVRIKAARQRAAYLERLHDEREEARRQLARSQAALQRLSQTLLQTQEDDQRRLARELHDDVTQRVAALAIQAEVTLRLLERDERMAADRLHEIVEAAQQLADDVQRLSHRLHPIGIRTLGLSEAVRQECTAFERRAGLAVRLVDELGDAALREEVEVTALRVVQEGLHNVHKHARAARVEVGLQVRDGSLVLSLRDDGRGFDLGSEGDTGLGLVTMRERATAVGGSLELRSERGAGTTIVLTIPARRSTS